MILFFRNDPVIYAVQASGALTQEEIERLVWLFGGATYLDTPKIEGRYIGPRREMITPWSTNAVEITQNMGIAGIIRIEEFTAAEEGVPSSRRRPSTTVILLSSSRRLPTVFLSRSAVRVPILSPKFSAI